MTETTASAPLLASLGAGKSFDIIPLMAPYLDVHMLSPMLDFLRERQVYDDLVITKEKIRCVNRTNMTELVEDEYLRYPDNAELQAEFKIQQPILEERKNKSFEMIDNEPEAVKLVTSFFAQTELVQELTSKNSLTLEYLSSKHQITSEVLSAYYKFSKFKFECGMYKDVEEMLSNFLSIQQPMYNPVYVGALWGRLACHILLAKWSDTITDLKAVKEFGLKNFDRDAPASVALALLRQRAWLQHWALFLLLSPRDGLDALIEMFSERQHLQTMENLCPWLLRYFVAAVILSPTARSTHLNQVLQEIRTINYQYSDPMTEFLECIFERFDFDEAQIKLQECQQLVQNDFFLQKCADKFVQQARMLICEVYCTINRKVDLNFLAQKLDLSVEEAEKWMTDLAKTSTQGPVVDAKIDSVSQQVIMAQPVKSLYKQIVEQTRDLSNRSATLGSNLETMVKEQRLYLKQISRR